MEEDCTVHHLDGERDGEDVDKGHEHHLLHVLLLVEGDPVLVGGAHCVQGQEDVARHLDVK